MFERDKLSGSNFNDWFRSPKMVLRFEKKMLINEQPIPLLHLLILLLKFLCSEMRFMMLIMRLLVLLRSMSPELHRQLENSSPYEMLQELKSMFGKRGGVERDMCVGNKMHKAFPLPGIKFPLAEEVPTASEEGCHCQKKSEATARKIALLSKSRRNEEGLLTLEVPAVKNSSYKGPNRRSNSCCDGTCASAEEETFIVGGRGQSCHNMTPFVIEE
nr:hypothetical protein [Tanacetum cinerariifolium]